MNDPPFILCNRPSQAITACHGSDRAEVREPTTFSPMVPDNGTGRLADVAVGENLQRAPMGPIQITPGEPGWLIVRLPYTRERVAKIKTVGGRQWNPDGKYWTVPHSEEAINHLLALFAGEPVEFDPSLGPIRPPHHREPRPPQEIRPTVASTPKLFDQVRQAIQTRHYSYRTEEAYVGWIRRFILFHHKRRPEEMGAAEVSGFLTSLAVDRRVSASTQNQALAAILFLYKDVLNQDFGWLDDVVACETPPALAHRAHPAGSARCVGRD